RLAGRPGVVVLASADGDKLPFIVGATQEAIELGAKSGDLVKLLSGYVDGRGGGKPDMAQGSGANAAGLDAGFHAVREELAGL
ncbi:DHHA1 domain-containing protein, partial [Corynebacterium nasicanis]